jgi:SET domain-containing protein
MSIITRREIKKGEELSINYNGEVTDKSPVWFDVRKK